MAVISSHFAPRGRNTSVVQIYSYANKCMEGMLRCASRQQDFYFENLMQFLMLMDAVMDSDNQPQRGMEPRAFTTPADYVLEHAARARRKGCPIATFQISVLFRQNASWQGTVLWVNQDMESQFRSALELIGLLDNALSVSLEKTEKVERRA